MLVGAVERACLAEPASRVTFDDEEFRTFRRVLGAVGKLAGQAQLAQGRLAVDFFS